MIFIGFAIVLRRFIVYSLILTRIVILDPNIFSFSDLFAFVTLYLASTLSWHTKIWSQHVFQILLLPFHRFLLVGYVINGLLVTWWHDLSWTKYFFVLYNIFIIIQIYQTHVGLHDTIIYDFMSLLLQINWWKSSWVLSLKYLSMSWRVSIRVIYVIT